jgi:hypothetical protein
LHAHCSGVCIHVQFLNVFTVVTVVHSADCCVHLLCYVNTKQAVPVSLSEPIVVQWQEGVPFTAS